jgi:hypothetical protein
MKRIILVCTLAGILGVPAKADETVKWRHVHHLSKRPALPAFHTPLTHEIVCSLTGKLRGTHDERYGTFRS